MTDTKILIDRPLARRRDAVSRSRNWRHFLLDHVAADLSDRITGMTADFASALDLSPRAGGPAMEISKTGKVSKWILAPSGAPAQTRFTSGRHRPAPLPGHPRDHILGGGRVGERAGAATFEQKNAPGPVEYPIVVTDEEWLPFAPASFDLVVSGLGLHRVNDLPGTLIQINRALKPDGLFLAALFGGATLSELRTCLTEAEVEITGGASPRVLPFADVSVLGQLLGRAGFALPVADVERLTVRYATVFALMADLRAMGETNALHARSRTPLGRKVFFRAAEIYAARFADPDGRLRATFDIITLTGWHPHASQQQPLRPGSATTSLADVLKSR